MRKKLFFYKKVCVCARKSVLLHAKISVIMHIQKHILGLAGVIAVLCGCKQQNENITTQYPTWPEEQVFTIDTVDCSDLCCVPANAITVHEAIAIGKTLPSGTSTEETYYIKGLVKSFNTSKHEEGIRDYGNGCWYMQDSPNSSVDFYCFQTLGLNGDKFTSLDQIQVGDFVVVASKIYNYNGTIETMSKGASHVVCSSNDMLYPVREVDYYSELFANGIDHWSVQVKKGSVAQVWGANTSASGVTSAQAQIDGEQGAYPETEVWLVSPVYDLAKFHPDTIWLSFQTAYVFSKETSKNVQDYLRMKITTDGVNWTDIEIPNFNTGKTLRYTSNVINISNYISERTQIAFSYGSASDFAPRWNVTDIYLYEIKRARNCE